MISVRLTSSLADLNLVNLRGQVTLERRAFLHFQDWPMVFVASFSHSISQQHNQFNGAKEFHRFRVRFTQWPQLARSDENGDVFQKGLFWRAK
jgi:hypothetical protein